MATDFESEFNGRIERVNLANLEPGPIRHAELAPELLEELGRLYRAGGHYTCDTLEEWERDFMRDEHPENEAAVWQRIIASFQLYHEKHLGGRQLVKAEGGPLVHALIQISMGVGIVTNVKDVQGVDKYVARRLVASWIEIFEQANN